VIGDPATLICRVDGGDVKWFKNGMEINIDDDEEIFILPDGSLFFLSSRLEDTALYNCGYKEKNGNIVTSRPAAIIVVKENDDTNVELENVSDGFFEKEAHKTDENKTVNGKKIHVEYLEEDIPRKVYIISMIIVGAITVVIIAGAAVIFMKIKNLSMEQNSEDPNINNKELQKLVKAESQLQTIPPYFHSADVNHYETPLQFQQKVAADLSPPSYGHSVLPYRAYQDKQYWKLKPVYLLPNDTLNILNENNRI